MRRHRESAGLDQAAAAEAIMKSVTKVSRLESGQVSASALEIHTLLERYGVEDRGERSRLEKWARAGAERGWWLDYREAVRPDYADHIALESDATCVRVWEPALIPGLLRTPRYAESVIASGPAAVAPDRLTRLLKVSQERQRRFTAAGARLEAVVWEPAITSPSLGETVRDAQSRWLLEAVQGQNVTLRILPVDAVLTSGLSGPFTSFAFGGPDAQPEAVSVRGAAYISVMDDPEELDLYTTVFDRLCAAAMSPEQSVSRVEELVSVHSD